MKLGDNETGNLILGNLISQYPETQAAMKAKKIAKEGL